MASKVYVSKYKHTYGTAAQATETIHGCVAGSCSQDSNVLQANANFLAFPCKVSGTVAVVSLQQKGTISEDTPLIQHDDQVNEIAFSPFGGQNQLLTACQDTVARLWTIPEGGLEASTSTPTAQLVGNAKRLISCGFHPLASGVCYTTSVDEIRLWDIENQMSMLTLPSVHKGMVTSQTWDYTGSLMATSCKDKNLRIFDVRGNSVVSEVADHQGTKGGRAVWAGKQDLIFTIGFNKTMDREIAIWDIKNMSKKVQSLTLDINPASPMPFYDVDTNLVFLGGKGDSGIKVFEVLAANEKPCVMLSEMKHTQPSSGMALLPKSVCDVMKCEIARVVKLCPNGQVIPIRFEVQRQNNQFFHDDLFPDTWDQQPTGTASSWFGGADQPADRAPALFLQNAHKLCDRHCARFGSRKSCFAEPGCVWLSIIFLKWYSLINDRNAKNQHTIFSLLKEN
ncbi:hypothetical protein PPL_10604 [Heterostelium album PN500]|uniref:Coronin n=1 Tax=Heterostelium pallidum (strain ATCC 26659 / Pp 5 / PN500) TaxID=670386 RepID=D3BRJ3_HETP5|nr:hypothetical protein PPL_10604 [Heterostelium album PN500]EFA76025.1 hypothetical protein PPL_10604 [Heterostelium album PN500]|eukprot:XP_020428159.1 hypothetical protein PPL_10604 [Heterostelium album PN500]